MSEIKHPFIKLKKTRKKASYLGDIFKVKLAEDMFAWGRVLRERVDTFYYPNRDGAILVGFYNFSTKEGKIPKIENLNICNIILLEKVSSLYWTGGYYVTEMNIPLTEEEKSINFLQCGNYGTLEPNWKGVFTIDGAPLNTRISDFVLFDAAYNTGITQTIYEHLTNGTEEYNPSFAKWKEKHCTNSSKTN